MNDRQDPYGQDARHAQVYGYDEYGRPLYADPGYDTSFASHGSLPPQRAYDYGTGDHGTGQQAPVHDGYGQQGFDGHQQGYGGYDGQAGYDPGYGGYHGFDYTAYQQPEATGHHPAGPGPAAGPAPAPAPAAEPGPGVGPGTAEQPAVPDQPGSSRAERPVYDPEQFSFVDDADEESEDVIDWLKFTESRTERREEAKRRSKVRRRLLAVTLVLALLGGGAYLWSTDRLPAIPGLESTEDTQAAGDQVRDVLVVHLRETNGDTTSTALLVANETTEQGTTLLLPNDLAVTADGATVPLGEAVAEASAGEVRDGLSSLLGADIKGTWRLDSPYLEILVDAVGGITVDTDAEVPAPDGEDDEPLVSEGKNVRLNGEAAVAYALHRGEDEPATAQLKRFGQVMSATLTQLPATRSGATEVVRAMRQIADPSLPEEELGASLARLAGYAQAEGGAYETTLVPVEADGTLSDATADGLIRDVLGGTVTDPDTSGTVRVAVRNASGGDDAAQQARIALLNGGFNVAGTRTAEETQASSEVTYAEPAHRDTAREVASTLGIPRDAVRKGEVTGAAQVVVVLGEDFEKP